MGNITGPSSDHRKIRFSRNWICADEALNADLREFPNRLLVAIFRLRRFDKPSNTLECQESLDGI